MTSSLSAASSQVELARVFSSVRLLGPPMDEKLIRLVSHLFTAEEAEVAKHLPFYYPRQLAVIAKRARRDPESVRPILESMAERRTIYGGDKGYSLLPLIPGMFEYLLMRGDDTEWHREYARLLIDVFSTGYVKKYNQVKNPVVRNIPVQATVEDKNLVVSTDLMSEIIARHKHLAVANVCQCRQSLKFVGDPCKRATPEDGCLIIGSFAESLVSSGSGRMVTKEQMKDIVKERVDKGLVFLTGNVDPASPNSICTCCDCCCHALETYNHYQGQNLITPSHFIARVDEAKCKQCGKCARACNTHAHVMENKRHRYDADRCIGCGLCVAKCKEGAIEMTVNPAWRPPSSSFATLSVKQLPATLLSAMKAKLAD